MPLISLSFSVLSLGFMLGLFGADAVSSLSVESDSISQSQRDLAKASTRWCPPHPDRTKAGTDPQSRVPSV
jgi:hypothetical protein